MVKPFTDYFFDYEIFFNVIVWFSVDFFSRKFRLQEKIRILLGVASWNAIYSRCLLFFSLTLVISLACDKLMNVWIFLPAVTHDCLWLSGILHHFWYSCQDPCWSTDKDKIFHCINTSRMILQFKILSGLRVLCCWEFFQIRNAHTCGFLLLCWRIKKKKKNKFI